MALRRKLNAPLEVLQCEEGSVSILIIGLFSILLIVSLAILDLSDLYLAKRELLQISEHAVNKASHDISLSAYYSGSFENSAHPRVPLDCSEVANTLLEVISHENLRGERVSVKGWSCQGDLASVTISSEITPAVRFPLLNSIFGSKFAVSATTAAASVFKGV